MALETGGPAVLGDRHQLSEQVAAHVREAIMVGELKAGEYVRTETLAAALQVSTTPVREALMTLHSEGAVRWEPRRGFLVVPVTAQDVRDLFMVQAFIAGELAARAAEVISAADVAQLRQVHAQLAAASAEGDRDRVFDLNYEIHRRIKQHGVTSRLVSLLDLNIRYIPRRYYSRIDGSGDASVHDHEAIFRALERQDPEASRAAMVEHIQDIGALLSDFLQRNGMFEAPVEIEEAPSVTRRVRGAG